jgi:clan AA aspartic protease (TIGR02281 family)
VPRLLAALFFVVFCVGLSVPAYAQDRCQVADPTGSPLNVRTFPPNGNIIATLRNGIAVSIVQSASVQGKSWAYIGRADNRVPLGWVFRDYLDCGSSAAAMVLPSFDCRRAKAPDEITICSNAELSELDNAVVSGYGYVRQERGDAFARQTNVPLFQARQSCSANAACIRERQIDAVRTYHDLGAPVNFSVWTHNGSMIDLVSVGRSRTYFYQTPRPELASAGVVPGTVLFKGESQNLQYFGTAYRFSSNCGRIVYQVSGPILDDAQRVVLTGRAPRVASDCSVNGSFEDTLDFRLAKQTETATATASSQVEPAGTKTQVSVAPSTRAVIELKSDGGIFVVPVLINGAITLDFVVDSGASDVSIPADVVSTLIRTGTIGPSDFIGKETYVLADGSKAPSDVFTIRSLKVGNHVVENVRANISPPQGTLLLGQSFLQHFKSWSIDNTRHALVLDETN